MYEEYELRKQMIECETAEEYEADIKKICAELEI